MKTVDLYHLVGIAALFLLALCITLGANDGVVLVIGIGIIVILLLGVHLVLYKQDKRLCVIEKKLEKPKSFNTSRIFGLICDRIMFPPIIFICL